MKLRLSALLICACLGSGLAHAEPESANEGRNAGTRLPKLELTPQLLHQFLVAEFAGHRGQLSLAVGAYRDLAATTRDPRIARRAAEIALFARQYDAALDAARIWSEEDPASQPARQMLATLLAANGRAEELSLHLTKMLAAAGKDVGEALLQLNRILARNADKPAVRKLVDTLTAPYLGVAEAHFVRAVAAFEAKDQVAARHEIDRALALRPEWERAALLRAQATPRGAEMLADLKAFVAANPAASEARLAYARALVGEKQFEDARREFTAILGAHPDNPDLIYAVAVLSLQLNDPSLAEGHLKRLVELNYTEANSARLYLGQIAEERKRTDEALQWYGQIGAGEQYLPAQVRIAAMLAHSGRLDEARERLQKARAANPRERTQLILGEAQLLREAGRIADAYEVLEAGIKLQPDQPELLYEAALAAEKIGLVEVLERRLRRLIELQPDHAHAYNALGYSLADRGERLDEAQRLIDKALELAPDDPFIMDSKGWLLYRKGETAAALELLRKALALRADPEIAAHFGEVLWVLGRRDEALEAWGEAAQASPDNEALAATIKRFKP
jgi:tetratricopeptide (TPR) repeat protein